MAEAVFSYDDDAIDYRPTVDTSAGTVVVQGDLVGVTKRDIKANELGALAVVGAFDFVKVESLALTVGTIVYWDNGAKNVTSTAGGNKRLGLVVRDAADTDARVRVKLIPQATPLDTPLVA